MSDKEKQKPEEKPKRLDLDFFGEGGRPQVKVVLTDETVVEPPKEESKPCG